MGPIGSGERRHARRGLWLAPTFDGMVAVDGLLEPEAGQSVLPPWNRWPARPTPPTPEWSQRNADALTELARRTWRAAGCPTPVGSARS